MKCTNLFVVQMKKTQGLGPVHQSEPWCIKQVIFFYDENPFIIFFYSQKIPINPLSNKPILGTTFAAKDEFS